MPVERELVTLEARDGAEHDALLHLDERAARARERRTGRRTAVLHVHGIMGNFLVGTLRFLPGPLAREGFPTMVLQTRMGDVGQLFGQAIVDDALLDLDAAVDWLRRRGYDHLILSGYSSGATIGIRYAARRHLPHLRGLVSIGCPWGLPQSAHARSRRWRSEPSYERIAETVREAVEGPDRLFLIHKARGPGRAPADSEIYTYRTWWDSRGPEASSAMAHRQIGAVRAPIVLVQGRADEVVGPGEAERLAQVAREGGNLDVELVWLEEVGHSFAGGEIATIEAVVAFLRRRA